jgi:signal transduction histidine kinase
MLYTGLFVVCGAIVVAITYGLVASLPQIADSSLIRMENAGDFLVHCRQALGAPDADPELLRKCDLAFMEGVVAGAQGQQEATLQHLLQYSLVTLAAVAILAAFAGWIVAGRVLRPVHQITAAARTASEHNLSARLSLSGPRDELRELADTFDDMLGRLQSAFEGQRRFIANASHELRTPLTVMRTTVDVVLAKPTPTPTELRGMGQDIRTAIDQSESLIDALLTLARNEHGLSVREEVDLATVAEDVLDSIGPGDRQVCASLQPALTCGDPVLLARLAANLVDNAVRYNVAGGYVWVSTSTVDGRAALMVANTGHVIAPDAIEGMFQPFRRLHDRSASDGFGLGLAIVASIAAAHNATIAADPMPDGGLKITAIMPATAVRPLTRVMRP